MSSLEEIKEELKKANGGSAPAVELQQAHNIEIRHLLKSFLSSVRGITAAGPSATATSSLAVSNSSDEQEVPVRVVGGDVDVTFSPSAQVVPVQVVGDDTEKDGSDDSDNEEEGSQTSLLTSLLESFEGLGKGFGKFISVFKLQKKEEKRKSSLGKDFDKGKEEGNVFKMAGDQIKSPLLKMVDRIKVIVANIMQWAGKIFGFLASIFSPVTVVLIGLYSGLKDAFSAWTDTEGSTH